MSDPRPHFLQPTPAAADPEAAEGFGNVLHNIRRLIAEDDALSAARDRLQALRDRVAQEDGGEFLARRHGGNPALARQLAGVDRAAPAASPAEPPAADDGWPLGTLANAPDAPRPVAAKPARPQNDLARRMGSLFDEIDEDEIIDAAPLKLAPEARLVLATRSRTRLRRERSSTC
jgi:hypothetical protein